MVVAAVVDRQRYLWCFFWRAVADSSGGGSGG